MMFAVHLADRAVTPPWMAGGWLAAAVLVGLFARRIPDDQVPRVGLVTAALFVASQIHIPVGPASVHLLLNGLAGVMLGRSAVAAIAVSLGLQAFLFGHGGLSTLGLNLTIYALPVLLCVWWRPASTVGGAALGGLTAAGSVALNAICLLLGGSEGVNDERVAMLVVLAHLPVVAIEAVVTGFAVATVRAADQPGNTSGNGVSH